MSRGFMDLITEDRRAPREKGKGEGEREENERSNEGTKGMCGKAGGRRKGGGGSEKEDEDVFFSRKECNVVSHWLVMF